MKLKQRVWGLVMGMAAAMPGMAQERPDLTLRYQELTEREQLQFSMKGQPDLSKPVGALNWEFPPTTFATVGFDPELKTFCMDPLTPVTSGMEYGFRIDTFGTPKDFGLADDEAGRKMAVRRAKYVKELYGRYYGETVRDPQLASAAFQTALWEVTQETELPDGPMPFSLYNGTFKVKATPADAPMYVQTAQKYVQSLTGDDVSFSENTVLAGQNLVRLSGLRAGANSAAQSQLSLRSTGGGSSFPGQAQQIGSSSLTGGQQIPLGILNRGLTGFSGYGQGQGGGSGGGFGGGGGFVDANSNSSGDGDGGNQNPITPTDPANIVINNNPVFNNNNTNTNTNSNSQSQDQIQAQLQAQLQQQQQQQAQAGTGGNQANTNTSTSQNSSNQTSSNQNSGNNPTPGTTTTGTGGDRNIDLNINLGLDQNQSINFNGDGPNPVPAPPAAILGMVALGMFGIRKLRGAKKAD